MPIRINLLAEAQAIEEARQRDPVKRVILFGSVVVALVLVYSSSLFVKTMIANGEVNSLEQGIESRKNDFSQVMLNQNNLLEDKLKLALLFRLSTNRFLMGNLLEALQNSTLDNVQLVRLKVTQTYVRTEEVKPKPRAASASDGPRVIPKPATTTETIILTLSAKDTSPIPGDAIAPFQKKLSSTPYFRDALSGKNEFRLISMGTPELNAEGKSFVLFTIEARFPEKTR